MTFDRNANIPARPPSRPTAHVLALFVLVLGGVGLAALPGAAPAARAQSANLLYLPDLHSSGYTTSPLPAALLGALDTPLDLRAAGVDRAARVAGIEGFGYSVVEVTNPNAFETQVTARLDKRGRNPQTETFGLDAGMSQILRLGALRRIDDGFWNGTLDARDPVGAVVRSDWRSRGDGPSGGTIIYEALTPSRRFLVPMLVRGVDGLYGEYHIMNADEEGGARTNNVRFQFFNADDGGIESEWEDVVEKGGVVNVDSLEFGTSLTRLPSNLPGGDFVGGFHVQAQYPIVMIMKHNEAFEGGVGAAAVRDWDAAVTEQYLPVVRSNYLGDTLIGLINRENSPVDVELRYQGAPDSPNHAGKEVTQRITMAPRSSAAIDLGARGHGTVAAPAITRGSRPNSGFVGSARIASSGRVQGSVLESSRWMTMTRTAAAWNPFTPEDLGETFVVPAARHMSGKRVTQFAIHNPGDAPLNAGISYVAIEGQVGTQAGQVMVPPGETRMLATDGKVDFIARATIASDGPVAVLVYDTPFATLADFDNRDNLLDMSAYRPIRIGEGDLVTPRPPPTIRPTVTSTPTEAPPGETPDPTATATESPDGTPIGWAYMPWSYRSR